MASKTCHRIPHLTSFTTPGRTAFTKPRRCTFSTVTETKTTAQAPLARQRPCIVARVPPKAFVGSAAAFRHASSNSATPNQSQIPDHVLTWDRFFDLRRKRRFVNLASSITTAVGAVGVFGPIIAQQDIDGWAAQLSGLDPLLVLGATTFAVAAGGWLCGPSIGNLGFKVWAGRRGWNHGVGEKEKSFYDRIRRYRADPSASSPQNPIPDYYGEKIASVKDYRRWLKDQRAFNLKKNKAFV